MRGWLQNSDVHAWQGITAVTLAGCAAAIAVVFAVMAMLVLRQK